MTNDTKRPDAAPAALDIPTIKRFLSTDTDMVLRLCLKMAHKGDAELAQVLLELCPSGLHMNASSLKLLLDTRVPDALLQSNSGHESLALAWWRAAENMAQIDSAARDDRGANNTEFDDFSSQEAGLMHAVREGSTALASFLVKCGADPCEPFYSRCFTMMPEPGIGKIYMHAKTLRCASALCMDIMQSPLRNAKQIDALLSAAGEGLLTRIPFGYQFEHKDPVNVLPVCATARHAAEMVSTVLKHCDPNALDVRRGVLQALEVLADMVVNSESGMVQNNSALGGIAEILVFIGTMKKPLTLLSDLIAKFDFGNAGLSGALHHALVDCDNKSSAMTALRVLQSAGIDIMTPDSRGSTALHRAAEGGFGEIVQGLLEMGASPLSLDKAGRTPELVARGQNQIEAMAIFQSYDAKNAIMRVINNNAANKAVNNASNTKGISRT